MNAVIKMLMDNHSRRPSTKDVLRIGLEFGVSTMLFWWLPLGWQIVAAVCVGGAIELLRHRSQSRKVRTFLTDAVVDRIATNHR